MNRFKGVAALFADRWQIPLAICALLSVGVALYRIKPRREQVPFDALMADVLTLMEHEKYYDAADAVANLLEQDPPLPTDQQGVLHDTLAEIIFREERLRELPNAANLRLLLEHSDAALACGHKRDARAALRCALAHEWLGERKEAIASYRVVLDQHPGADARRAALQGLVRLLEGDSHAAGKRRTYIQELLDEPGIAPGYLWWAIQQAIRDAIDHGDFKRAQAILARHGKRFQRSDLKGYYDYLQAWVHLEEGRPELAGPLVDRVEQWLATHQRGDGGLDEAGFLPAMSQCLRGQIELAEARPQSALGYFARALQLQSHGELLVAATRGRVEALAMLQRHKTAREVVQETLARLESDPPTLAIARPRLQRVIDALALGCAASGRVADALGYLGLELDLTPQTAKAKRLDLLERFGHENERAAELTTKPDEARRWHAAAAQAYEQATRLAVLDEPRLATLTWSSATQYDQAGEIKAARRMLRKFVEGRSADPRMPQALLRLGQSYAADGQFEEAIKQYRRLARDYPRLSEAQQARLSIVDSLIALGQDRYDEAEQMLRDLLEDPFVTPGAEVYRDALARLCDLLYQRRAYAEAIGRMEDFLVFYPHDPEQYRIRFMLADAYRASAYALAQDASLGPAAARERVSRQRFRRAAELFGEFFAALEGRKHLDRMQATYRRLALFYRGDCLFELNEPDTLAEALAVYRQAAARYQGEPAALIAQVQIANIYLRQGKITEAARAVERARWLLGSIPDRMFADQGDGMGRVEWGRYLAAIRSSELFRNVLAQAP